MLKINQKNPGMLEWLNRERLLTGIVAAYCIIAVVAVGRFSYGLRSTAEAPASPELPMRDALAALRPAHSALTRPLNRGSALPSTAGTEPQVAVGTGPAVTHRRWTKEELAAVAAGAEDPAALVRDAVERAPLRGLLARKDGFSDGNPSGYSRGLPPQSPGTAAADAARAALGTPPTRGEAARRVFASLRFALRKGFAQNGMMLMGGKLSPTDRAAGGAGAYGPTTGFPAPGGLAAAGGGAINGAPATPGGSAAAPGADKGGGGTTATNDPPAPGPEPAPEEAPPEEEPPVEEEAPAGQCLARGAARCDAFTCAATDSTDMSGAVDGAAASAVAALRGLITAVQGDIDAVLQEEQGAREASQRRYSCDGCEGVNNCLDSAASELQGITSALQEEKANLASASGCLGGADASACAAPALAAIAKEESVAQLVQAHAARLQNAKRTCTASIPDTQTHCSGQGEQRSCGQVPYEQGRQVKSEFGAQVDQDSGLQGEAAPVLTKSWCQRHSCAAIDVAALRQRLRDHNDAVQVWAGELQGASAGYSSKADAKLSAAEPLLAAPDGGRSRNFVNGVAALSAAGLSVDQGNQGWARLRDGACTGGN